MSHSGKKPSSELGFDDRFRDSLSSEPDKPDFRELDLGSPVTTLRTRPSGLTSTSTSSSSSSGSITGRNANNSVPKRSDFGPCSHSGELSVSSEGSPTAGRGGSTRVIKPGHAKSDSVTSPHVNVLPTGNICPSGRVLKTGMASGRSSRTDVLGTGTGNYGHGSIMRGGGQAVGGGGAGGGGGGGGGVKRAMSSVDPEEVKRAGNEQYRKGNFSEALSLYDRAIRLCPSNAAYRGNRAAALGALGRLGEAVRECEEAVRLDPQYWRAHQRLTSLFIRWVVVVVKS